MYDSPETAEKAYQDLTTRHGYKSDDISVMMSDDTRKRHFGDVKPGTEFNRGTKAAEGRARAAAIGGGIGAAVGGTRRRCDGDRDSRSWPGGGRTDCGALAGAGAGGATGGIVGALVGAGIPEERAREYERGISDGGIVIGTRRATMHTPPSSRGLHRYGARNVLR